MGFIPYKLIQKAIIFYTFSLNILSMFFTQTKRTALSIVDSFSSETLYFFPESSIPLITSSNKRSIINPKLEGDCWSFCNNKFRNLQGINTTIKKLPYISASLYKDTLEVADLSEWIMNIEVLSSGQVPIRFIVLAWAYSTGATLESFLTCKYYLHVITTDGDEHILDVKSA